jgi:precorrin-6B methylase 2
MLDKIQEVLKVLLQPKILKKLISMHSRGYLNDIGWMNSFKQEIPVDKENKPLPWVTYSFIDFISGRLNNTLNIFEFGSGNSTIWYAKKVKSVISVEHDENWFEKIKNNMPDNVNINYKKLVYGGEYSNFSNLLNKKFNIIIVDGRDRVNSIINSTNSLCKDGVIILDDSEREEYIKGVQYLQNNGYKKLDFWGISPGYFLNKCTSVFYRDNNCLGI